MTFLASIHRTFGSPPVSAMLQFCAHITYIVISFFLFALQRPVSTYLLTVLISLGTYWLFYLPNNRGKQGKIGNIPFAGILIGNSVFLNIEGHGFFPYILAAVIGVCSRWLIQFDGRHIFNPSAIGVFFVTMCFPTVASLPSSSWEYHWWFSALILMAGTIVTVKAKQFVLAVGYQLAFCVTALGFYTLNRLFVIESLVPNTSPLLFPSVLLSANSLIFTYHVITDPRTSPRTRTERFFYGAAIGCVDLTLRQFAIIPAAFLAYNLVAAGRVLGITFLRLLLGRRNQASIRRPELISQE